jgi:hypothetical protein
MTPTDAGSQFPENGMSATPRTDDVLDDNNYFAGSTFIALRNLCRQLEVELKEAEQVDNAANHYLARAEKAEAALATERKKVVDEITEKNAPEIAKVNAHIADMTARAEKAEAECVEWRRLLQMSRDDREHDLVSEINDLKRQLIDRVEQTKAPYTEPKAT